MLTCLFSLFYVTGESYCFLHRRWAWFLLCVQKYSSICAVKIAWYMLKHAWSWWCDKREIKKKGKQHHAGRAVSWDWPATEPPGLNKFYPATRKSFHACTLFWDGTNVYSLLWSKNLWVRSFGVICIRISDPKSLRSLCVKGTDECTLVTYSSLSLMLFTGFYFYALSYDSSDLGSLILIQPITQK